MDPLVARRPEVDGERHDEVLESLSRELSDLFCALTPIISSESEAPYSPHPASYLALEEAERLLTAYSQALSVGLCVLDIDLRYLAVNKTLADMNRLPPAEHLGKSVRELLGDFAEIVEPQFRRVIATRQSVMNLQISATPPSSNEPGHWVVHCIPIKDGHGKVAQIGAVVVEVTEQKRLEASLQTAAASLRKEKKRHQVMAEISNILTTKEVRQAFPKISSYLRRVLRQEYAALALHDEKSGQLIRHAIDFPLRKGPPNEVEFDVKKDPRGKALIDRTPLIFTKDQMRSFPGRATEHLLAEGMKSLCCVPLFRPKGTLGVLVLGSTRTDAFGNEDLTLLNQVGAQLAISIENARTAREIEQLKRRIEQEKRNLHGENRQLPHFEAIVGNSAALRHVLAEVGVVATSDATVMVMGETGTGKGLIVRAINGISKRKEQRLVALNCAAIPTGLLESELFGHERGAFTGAVSRKIGRLEMAHNGTLFLDEIGEIPLELQPKLLRVLQDHEFERLGGTRTITVDLRLISATNRELAKSVALREFRSDLFYRLNVFPIRLPSLRERREDIPLLVRHFVKKFAAELTRPIESIPNETMQALTRWDWPGNVRELENFIERSVILTEGKVLQAPLHEFQAAVLSSSEKSLEGTQRAHILRALRESGGKISGPKGAARRLGLKRTTLQSKMKRLGIKSEEE